MKRAILFLILLAFSAALVSARVSPQASPAPASDSNVAGASITFDRVWEDYSPQNVTITVAGDGHTKYVSHTAAKPPDQEADDFQTEFTISGGCLGKLFLNARQANYFDGDFTFKKHNIASTGKKTLTYADSTRHFNTTYDYSENKAISEITNIFQGISYTVESGRRLKFKYRFDKLGLEDELKGMESAAESHNLVELQLIAPLLETIAQDSSVLNIARQRAKKLLVKAQFE